MLQCAAERTHDCEQDPACCLTIAVLAYSVAAIAQETCDYPKKIRPLRLSLRRLRRGRRHDGARSSSDATDALGPPPPLNHRRQSTWRGGAIGVEFGREIGA